MNNERAILEGDRLDTGMKASEAVARAELWWNSVGRHMIRKVGADDPTLAQFSGIVAGHAWSFLKQREQARVVKVWHHFKIRRGDTLDIAPDAPFKLGGKERVQ